MALNSRIISISRCIHDVIGCTLHSKSGRGELREVVWQVEGLKVVMNYVKTEDTGESK